MIVLIGDQEGKKTYVNLINVLTLEIDKESLALIFYFGNENMTKIKFPSIEEFNKTIKIVEKNIINYNR